MKLDNLKNFAISRQAPTSGPSVPKKPKGAQETSPSEPIESFSRTAPSAGLQQKLVQSESTAAEPKTELPQADGDLSIGSGQNGGIAELDKSADTASFGLNTAWQDGGVTYAGSGNGPLIALDESSAIQAESVAAAPKGQSLSEVLANLALPSKQSTAAMSERESSYLGVFPFKDGDAALKARDVLTTRYNDASTSAATVTETISAYASQRGVEIDSVPPGLTGDLGSMDLSKLKGATQGIVDKFFLSQEASFNPEKHATVSEQTGRFIDLMKESAPDGFSAGDAYKLVASNLALISYQDKAAAENMLGDHGVRHLLGHNINACEQLADSLEQQGTPVGATDRLVLHQTMIVHDLGYAMDSVRDPINAEGIKGQDAGHNVLAARYLRERADNPDDPLSKLLGGDDLDRMHRCILYHDKDKTGGPGVDFRMGANLSDEDRAMNLESITRVADNTHAFEDKLPELLYRKPESFKAMRLMKTAGEIGDDGLVDSLKGELAGLVENDSTLAKDDKEALLQSVSSVNAMSYKFSVGRVSGSKPSFDINKDGKVELTVAESATQQETSALFGMDSYKQMEKFVKDCSGHKVSLNGQTQRVEGDDVSITVSSDKVSAEDGFNTELREGLLGDRAFVKFAMTDTQLSVWQTTLEERQKLGEEGLEADLNEVKEARRQGLEAYRASATG